MNKFIVGILSLFIVSANAAEIFNTDEPVIDGLPVLEMSKTFADIYEKLDSVKWGGKDIRIAIESIENVESDIKIADTGNRVVVVSKDTIIGNWPRPKDGDWDNFGQITTAIILKLREQNPSIANMDEPMIYKTVVGAIMKGVNENGKYIYSKKEEESKDPHVLTSLGIAGVRTSNGNYILNTIFSGSPADTAGLEDGDILISANGVLLKDLSDMEVLGLFNGFSSGTIKIKAIGTNKKEKNVSLRRATVVIADTDIVLLKGEKNILQIIVHKISDNTVDIVLDALNKYDGTIDGIYLDMRGTTGDDERAMAKLAGMFLGQVPVARIVSDSDADLEIIPGGDAISDVPVVVAVSSATSGTAEALAFAFYENNTGVIIGMPTAGVAKLKTRVDLLNGGALELQNRVIKTGKNKSVDGRGFFPMVCLSNIRTSDQKDVFLVNVKNHEWNVRDFNTDETIDPKTVRKGCPNIKNGEDEDNVASAVVMDILFNSDVYKSLIKRSSDVSEEK
jgi:carboxyl-terminal processing protease